MTPASGFQQLRLQQLRFTAKSQISSGNRTFLKQANALRSWRVADPDLINIHVMAGVMAVLLQVFLWRQLSDDMTLFVVYSGDLVIRRVSDADVALNGIFNEDSFSRQKTKTEAKTELNDSYDSGLEKTIQDWKKRHHIGLIRLRTTIGKTIHTTFRFFPTPRLP